METDRTRELAAALLGIFCAMIMWITVFSREVGERSVLLEPLHTYKMVFKGNGGTLRELIGNILLLSPLGFLLPICARWKSAVKTIAVGFAFSLAIECIQYAFALGTFEVDDLINNTLGAALGYGLLALIRIIKQKIGAVT